MSRVALVMFRTFGFVAAFHTKCRRHVSLMVLVLGASVPFPSPWVRVRLFVEAAVATLCRSSEGKRQVEPGPRKRRKAPLPNFLLLSPTTRPSRTASHRDSRHRQQTQMVKGRPNIEVGRPGSMQSRELLKRGSSSEKEGRKSNMYQSSQMTASFFFLSIQEASRQHAHVPERGRRLIVYVIVCFR